MCCCSVVLIVARDPGECNSRHQIEVLVKKMMFGKKKMLGKRLLDVLE